MYHADSLSHGHVSETVSHAPTNDDGAASNASFSFREPTHVSAIQNIYQTGRLSDLSTATDLFATQ